MAELDVDAMIADVKTLVEIESPSLDLAQLHKSAEALATIIERLLGGRCELIESSAGPHVHWKGSDAATVLLLGHHDTVFPIGTLDRRPFAVTDGVMTGPGCFDMLAGIVRRCMASPRSTTLRTSSCCSAPTKKSDRTTRDP